MKKLKQLLLVCAMLFIGASAMAQTWNAGKSVDGKATDAVKATLVDGVLTISGTGEMEDYGIAEAPWTIAIIKSLVIKPGVTSIGNYAFYSTGLTSLTIPPTITRIGEGAFYGSSLTEATIPEGVKEIGSRAFYNCSKLTTVNFNATKCTYTSKENPLFSSVKTLNIGANVTEIPVLFAAENTSLTEVTIPGSVQYIGESAFRNCTGLTKVTISEGVEVITDYAFHNTGLTEVTIPEGVVAIGSRVFSSTGLTEVTIPTSVLSIRSRAFYDCTKLATVNYNATDCVFYQSVFEEKALTTLNIGANVKSIPTEFVIGCSKLKQVTIPEGVTSIGAQAFYDTGLTEVTIPSSVTSIDKSAFDYCGYLTMVNYNAANCSDFTFSSPFSVALKTLNIGKDVKYIPNKLAYNCTQLIELTISEGVTSIGNDAFCGTSITELTIPASVTSIGNGAFASCIYLRKITALPASPVAIGGKSVFARHTPGISLYVSYGSGNLYKKAQEWKDFADKTHEMWAIGSPKVTDLIATFNATSGILTISGEGDMANYTNDSPAPWYTYRTAIKSVVMEDYNMKTIGDYAFSGCSKITSIDIPFWIRSIGSYAFKGCSGLTSITTLQDDPKNITLGTSVFSGVNTATCSFYPPNGSSVLLYKNAPQWRDFTITEKLTWEIGYPTASDIIATFTPANSTLTIRGTGRMEASMSYTAVPWYNHYRTKIKSVVIENGVTDIRYFAFYECSNLTSVSIAASVTSIYDSAFGYCNNLTSISIPASVISIHSSTFEHCSKLTAINVDPNNTRLSSVDGVLFNKDKTILQQYPMGKTEAAYTIPASVSNISYSAFKNCSNLTSVTIPASVSKIEAFAFQNCSGLTSITALRDNPASLGSPVFENVNATACTLYVPGGKGDSYKAAAQWSAFAANTVEVWQWQIGTPNAADVTATLIGGTLTISGTGKMVDYTSATTNDAAAAPWNTTALISTISKVVIEEGVTSIGSRAFHSCTGLKEVTIPEKVTSIGASAFYNCTSLKEVTIPEKVTSIGASAFYNCGDLTVNYNAINCTSYPPTATALGSTTLKVLNIGEGVESLPANFARNCAGLTSVTIPASVKTIGTNAFASCTGITSITNYATQPQTIDENVFSATTYTEAKLTVLMASEAAYADNTIWAKFDTPTVLYTVTFDAGEDAGEVAPQYLLANETVTCPSIHPVKDDYVFYWMSGAKEYDFAAPVTTDLALTGAWLQDLTDEMIDSTTKIAELESNLSDSASLITTLRSDIADLELNLSALSSLITTLCSDIARLDAEVEELQTANNTLTGEKAELTEANEKLEETNEDLLTQIEELLAKLAACKGESTTIKQVDVSEVLVYPNPTNGRVYIETESNQVPQVRVFNSQGTLTQQVQSNEVNIEGASGLYLLEIDGTVRAVIKQ